jgi:hypothetical protein
LNLRDVLDDAAAEQAGVDVATGPAGELIWSRAGRPFAVLSGDGAAAEFALDRPVAAAAVRTPDVAPSPRDRDWVRFGPAVLDQHGADRAAAWFASAYRRLARD